MTGNRTRVSSVAHLGSAVELPPRKDRAPNWSRGSGAKRRREIGPPTGAVEATRSARVFEGSCWGRGVGGEAPDDENSKPLTMKEPPEGIAPSSFLATSEVPRYLGVGGLMR